MDWSLQNEYYSQEIKTICGCDEAGRGPLAGRVYAAAVVLPHGLELADLNDSKKLSAKNRDMLYDEIIQKAADYCIAYIEVDVIEEINILNAALLAMKNAVKGLIKTPDLALVDGNSIRNFDGINAKCIIKGDAKMPSIAAASVLAKVARDRYCYQLDALYPQYGFTQHKGYGTKAHIAAIKEYGVCPEHRMSFLKKILDKNEE